MEIPNPELKKLYEDLTKKYEKKYLEENWHIVAEAVFFTKSQYTESTEEKSKRTGYEKKVVEFLGPKMIQDEIRQIKKELRKVDISDEAYSFIDTKLSHLNAIAFIKAV